MRRLAVLTAVFTFALVPSAAAHEDDKECDRAKANAVQRAEALQAARSGVSDRKARLRNASPRKKDEARAALRKARRQARKAKRRYNRALNLVEKHCT